MVSLHENYIANVAWVLSAGRSGYLPATTALTFTHVTLD